MKQNFRFAIITALCLLTYGTIKTHAQQTPPRFVAATHEQYDGASFKPFYDSVRIHWHDTCGAGFNYFTYAYGSIADDFYTYITDTPGVSPRAYKERILYPFDTVYTYAPTPAGNGWLPAPSSRTTQVINNSNRPDTILKTENGTAASRMDFFYDASGKQIASNAYMETPAGLELSNIDSLFYDNNGNLVLEKLVDMYGTPYVSKILYYTYDNNNRWLQVEDSSRLNSTSPLVISLRAIFGYNALGQQVMAMSQLAPGLTGILANYIQEDRTYNSNSRQETHTFKQWSGTAWDTAFTYTYTYKAGTALLDTVYILGGPARDTTWRVQWYYNAGNRCDSVIEYRWAGPGLWSNNRKTTYTYNSFGQITHVDVRSGWDPATQTWNYRYHDRRSTCYYESTPTTIKDQTPPLEFSVYPNPTNGKGLYIRSGSEAIRLLSVYDVSGRLLIRQKITKPSKEVTFDLGVLAAGTYILHVNGEQATGSTKVVVQ